MAVEAAADEARVDEGVVSGEIEVERQGKGLADLCDQRGLDAEVARATPVESNSELLPLRGIVGDQLIVEVD